MKKATIGVISLLVLLSIAFGGFYYHEVQLNKEVIQSSDSEKSALVEKVLGATASNEIKVIVTEMDGKKQILVNRPLQVAAIYQSANSASIDKIKGGEILFQKVMGNWTIIQPTEEQFEHIQNNSGKISAISNDEKIYTLTIS